MEKFQTIALTVIIAAGASVLFGTIGSMQGFRNGQLAFEKNLKAYVTQNNQVYVMEDLQSLPEELPE
jgi:hypothetical protein